MSKLIYKKEDTLSRNIFDMVFRLCTQIIKNSEAVSEVILQVVVMERQAGIDSD